MNVELDQLTPGVYGVSYGSGLGGKIIRDATGSEAGHAFEYLGGGQMIEGAPPKARIVPANKYSDAKWAWRMWTQLQAKQGWTAEQVTTAQGLVVGRGHALEGTDYDWPAYIGFSLEVIGLRKETELESFFKTDTWRVCSALVDDAETFGKVPMNFIPEDGPGLESNPNVKVTMPPNLVAPGMLLGLALRNDWM